MTLAPTIEIAIGRKISVFATNSNFDRSARIAINKPNPTLNSVPKISQKRLLRYASSMVLSVKV